MASVASTLRSGAATLRSAAHVHAVFMKQERGRLRCVVKRGLELISLFVGWVCFEALTGVCIAYRLARLFPAVGAADGSVCTTTKR